MLFQEGLQGLPGEPSLLAALRQRMFPFPLSEVPERLELPRITRQPVVIEVTPQYPIDRTGLLLYGMMFHPAQQIFHPSFRPAETLALRLEHRLADGLTEAPGSINREAKKRQSPPFMGPVIRARAQIRRMGLLLGKRQPKLRQTRLQQSPHGVYIRRIPEERAEIVRVADQFGPTLKPRFHLPLEPKVHDIMEVDVGQQW